MKYKRNEYIKGLEDMKAKCLKTLFSMKTEYSEYESDDMDRGAKQFQKQAIEAINNITKNI